MDHGTFDNRKEFKRLQDLANGIEDTKLRALVEYALVAGEGNAIDTMGCKEDDPRYWQIAYDSVCSTAAFNENKRVADWFIDNGYLF